MTSTTEHTASSSINDALAGAHYRMRIVTNLSEIGQARWDAFLAKQTAPNPFLSYAFLDSVHSSQSACTDTGWTPCFITLWEDQELVAALILYRKMHSYGEYVFDWAWADAYQRNGLDYYPKLLSAVPFTPVAGNRLLALNENSRRGLIEKVLELCGEAQLSSIHILLPTKDEADELEKAGFLLRKGVQFHWINRGYANFDEFLATLEHKKRKNIRAERRKVAEAGVRFRHVTGTSATTEDWRFFKRCYDQTYRDHHSTPYLNFDFFERIGRDMPQYIHLVIAEQSGTPVAASLLIHNDNTLYGRYWGCVSHINCLHFETSFYQAIEFCITKKIHIFEGGAQGEHKMARGFLPVATYSAHYLAEPLFYDAVARFLDRETDGVDSYISELNERNPFKQSAPPAA
jgi:uncharacterized protein